MNTHLSILHLERRKDRMDNLLKQLKEQDITFYSIIEGIEDKKNTKKAIHLSHKKIVQSAKNNNLPNCIIAEDDVTFTAKGAWQYFLSQIPESYDMFFSLVYAGEVKDNRVMNGMSGVCTLYSVHERFYDFFLSQPIDTHVDRQLGNFCHQFEFYVVPEYCCYQLGGFSDNLKRVMYYHEYLRDKKLFGV